MRIRGAFIILFLMMLGGVSELRADGTRDDVESLYKYRLGVTMQIPIVKGLKLNLEPEFRFFEGYDKMMLNGGLRYKTFGCLYFGATYRLEIDRVEGSGDTQSYYGFGENKYDSELFHRYAFDVTYKDKFGRFTPSFRVRYNNFADEEITSKEYLRYRAKVEYNIKKCRFTPSVGVEAFQEMEDRMLYKMRYSAGWDYKLSKVSSLGIDYKFDLFALEYKNAHIFSVGYRCKF